MARGKGWLDEFWAVLLAIPFVLCFMPGLQGVAEKGFSILSDQVPAWYQTGIGAALAFAFGRDRAVSVASRIFRKQSGGE